MREENIEAVLPEVAGFNLWVTAEDRYARGTKVRPDFKLIARNMVKAEMAKGTRLIAVMRDTKSKLALDRVFRRMLGEDGKPQYKLWTHKVREDILLVLIRRPDDKDSPLSVYPRQIAGSRYGHWKAMTQELHETGSVKIGRNDTIGQLRIAYAKYYPEESQTHKLCLRDGSRYIVEKVPA